MLVTDQLPYPPRNGVTLPIYNYAIALRAQHELTVCLLLDVNALPATEHLKANEERFGTIPVVSMKRRRLIPRLFGELSGSEMFQHGWYPSGREQLGRFAGDALIVSPMSAVAKWRALRNDRVQAFRTRIAAVSDCTTAEYYFRAKQNFGGVRYALKGLLDRLRSPTIGKIEAQLLTGYHHILLQTRTDALLMARLVSEEIATRVTLVPNGIRSDLFHIEPTLESRLVVLVAELSGDYGPVVMWFVDRVWPKVMRAEPEWRLHIVGKGGTARLQNAINRKENISHTGFVEDLCDLYRQAAIVVSPVFKGYGLINKTLEAMAAGVPVVGGSTAFNGIPSFANGKTGIACTTNAADEFADAIVSLAKDLARRKTIGDAGRQLVRDQFRWHFCTEKIERLLPTI